MPSTDSDQDHRSEGLLENLAGLLLRLPVESAYPILDAKWCRSSRLRLDEKRGLYARAMPSTIHRSAQRTVIKQRLVVSALHWVSRAARDARLGARGGVVGTLT